MGVVVGFVACMGLTACAPQTAQDSPELAAMAERWQEVLNSGDHEGVVALYTADARLMPPHGPMDQGADAVRAEFGGMIDAGLTGQLATLEARVAGDLGYRVGTYRIFAPDGSELDRGKYIETWEKNAAGWQITNDIWNSDLPEGAGLTYVSVTHEVEDPERWLAAWTGPDSREKLFAAHGAGDVRVFQSPDDPARVGLLVEIQDMDALMALMNSPEGQAAKAEDGVLDSTLHFMLEVK
jgi:ketosteroid isomerase-like protein